MPVLRIGSTGDDVVSLQLALVAVGLLAGEPTGQFDVVTQKAVMEVQRRGGLPQTGVMDESAWNVLFQMQASVAPSPDTYTPGTGPTPSTTYLDPTDVQGRGPSRGQLLFFGALAAGAYWFANRERFKSHGTNEFEDDEEEDDDFEDEEDDYEDDDEQEHVGDYEDAVTDSLIEAPARMSQGGRAADCKKAAMRLMRVQALVQRPAERSLYDNVVRKVATNCRGEEKAIEAAIEDEAARQEDMTDDLLDVIGQTPVRDRAKDSDRDENIEQRKKAQALYKRRARDERDDGPSIDTRPNREQSRRKLYESGFRKVKTKLTKKTTTEPEKERSGRGKGQGHRRGSSAVEVRRGGKVVHRMRKEKAKTKRGYTWRKEND